MFFYYLYAVNEMNFFKNNLYGSENCKTLC